MRTGDGVDPRDLSGRARIRDAAIGVFGEQGFGAGVRAVAAAAGVSAGLVNHHFGSKEGLRAACDERVLEIIRTEKAKSVEQPGPASVIAALAEVEAYGPVVAYMLRSFQAGGPLAESLLENMISDAERNMAAGVEAGLLKPSRDSAARARYLTLCHVGATNLYLQMRLQREGKLDYRKAIRDLIEITTLPALELYTQGLLAESSIFDALTQEN